MLLPYLALFILHPEDLKKKKTKTFLGPDTHVATQHKRNILA